MTIKRPYIKNLNVELYSMETLKNVIQIYRRQVKDLATVKDTSMNSLLHVIALLSLSSSAFEEFASHIERRQEMEQHGI
jgi:hypothetical protein